MWWHTFLWCSWISSTCSFTTITRPDVAYCVSKLSDYMHTPNTVHMQATKRLLHYLKGTLDYGLHLRPSSDLHLRAFCDSDWGGDSTDMKSSVAYIIYLGPNAIYLGPVRNIKQLPNHPRRQSIEPLVPLQLKFFCYENFSKIFISISLAHHMYTPTTLEPHIYVSTRCSTLAWSMSPLNITLFVILYLKLVRYFFLILSFTYLTHNCISNVYISLHLNQ